MMSRKHFLNPWIMWFVASIFYFYEMVLRISPSVMTKELMAHFDIASTGLGFLASIYLYPYVALQIPCGLIVDKFGVKGVISLSALISAVGILLFSYSELLFGAQVARFLIGAGAACGFISCLKLIGLWFPREKFDQLCGLTNVVGTMAGLVSGYPLARSVKIYGWENTCFYAGIVGIFISVLAWLIIKNKKNPEFTKKSEANFLDSLKRIIRNKELIIIGLVSGLMYTPINTFAEVWAVPFLKNTYKIETENAAFMSVLIFFGSAISSAFIGRVAAKVGSYVKVMQWSCLLSALLFVFIALGSYYSSMMMVGILIFLGISVGVQILAFSWVNESVGLADLGAGVGFCNSLTMLSGLFFQPFLGYVLDLFWNGEVSQEGVRIYSENAYIFSILTIPVCFIISFFLLLLIKEKHIKRPLRMV